MRTVVIAARKARGLSQAQLAEKLGKAKSHVAMIERGQRRIDTLELYYMAKCFGLDPADLFAKVALAVDEALASGEVGERPAPEPCGPGRGRAC